MVDRSSSKVCRVPLVLSCSTSIGSEECTIWCRAGSGRQECVRNTGSNREISCGSCSMLCFLEVAGRQQLLRGAAGGTAEEGRHHICGGDAGRRNRRSTSHHQRSKMWKGWVEGAGGGNELEFLGRGLRCFLGCIQPIRGRNEIINQSDKAGRFPPWSLPSAPPTGWRLGTGLGISNPSQPIQSITWDSHATIADIGAQQSVTHTQFGVMHVSPLDHSSSDLGPATGDGAGTCARLANHPPRHRSFICGAPIYRIWP